MIRSNQGGGNGQKKMIDSHSVRPKMVHLMRRNTPQKKIPQRQKELQQIGRKRMLERHMTHVGEKAIALPEIIDQEIRRMKQEGHYAALAYVRALKEGSSTFISVARNVAKSMNRDLELAMLAFFAKCKKQDAIMELISLTQDPLIGYVGNRLLGMVEGQKAYYGDIDLEEILKEYEELKAREGKDIF
ncbi:MAG: hypothetical protein QW112_01460 [Candidatus Micrarchaeia archaeon]